MINQNNSIMGYYRKEERMIGKLKALGLLLGVVLVIGATTAPAALAQGKLVSDGPVTLAGTQVAGASTNTLTLFGQKVECSLPIYTGHKYNVTPHELIPSSSTTITITAHHSSCFSEGFPLTIDMNGCDYVLHIEGTTSLLSDTYGVKTTSICPEKQHIQLTVFSSGTHSIRICTMTFTEKAEGNTGLHFTDTTEGKIDLTGAVTGLIAHKSGLCGTSTTESGEWHSNVKFEGRNSLGSATAIALTD